MFFFEKKWPKRKYEQKKQNLTVFHLLQNKKIKERTKNWSDWFALTYLHQDQECVQIVSTQVTQLRQ